MISDLFLDISDELTENPICLLGHIQYILLINSYAIYGVKPQVLWPKIFNTQQYTAIKIDKYIKCNIEDKLKSFLNRIPKFNYSFTKNEYTTSRPSDLERETFIEISIIKNNI